MIKVLSISQVEGRGALRAYVDIQVGDLVVKDCRIIKENEKAPWFSLPVITWKTEQGTYRYRAIIEIKDQNLKNEVSRAALQAWEKWEFGGIDEDDP